jgi:predicted dehydrogenase
MTGKTPSSNSTEIRIALAGIGGYGEGYLRELLKAPPSCMVRFVAAIDPAPQRCRFLADLNHAGVPVFPSLEIFFTQSQADLVILSSPIHMHPSQTCLALAQGCYVLCEKPVCAVIQDALRMAEVEHKSGKFVAIGYQMSFTAAIQALKRDIHAGDFGNPVRLKTRILWPRRASYYHRNRWAGRIKSDTGEWVLDSPANNAMAHYLHNALYVLGDTPSTSARPASVQAELYRANPIENYDTAVLRVITDKNVEVLFYGAHPVPDEAHPVFSYEFEAATIEYSAYSNAKIVARFKDGSMREYPDPTGPGAEWDKLWHCVRSIRSGEPILCGIEAASAHTLCINGAQESTEITSIPPECLHVEPRGEADTLTWVVGLQETIKQCYAQGVLPADTGAFPWTRTGKVVDLAEYDYFPKYK